MKQLMAICLCLTLVGCPSDDGRQANDRHYTSAVVQGNQAAINLADVEQAFTASKGSDFDGWMRAFEQRVNEIYTGDGVVAIDAQRKGDRLVVQGFVDKNGQEGLQDADQKLFSLEQTGPATRDAVPIRTADGYGNVYHESSLGLLGNPFLQAFLISTMMSRWGGHYFTPAPQLVVLSNHRTAFQRTPAYQQQIAANKQFQSRFQPRAAGGVQSRRAYGTNPTTTQTAPRRSWGTSTAGRRTTGGGGGVAAPRRRSWGGRRR